MRRLAFLLAIFVGGLSAAHADELKLNGKSNVGPQAGITMQAVEAQYGAPNQRLPAVGDPPITRWEYGNFTVYFEHDRVIHSVAHNR